jgi:asparagine synthase (glutamine-hydrolysing)
MGGFAGLIDFTSKPDVQVVKAMSTRIAHQGVHGQGTFSEGPIAVAHRLGAGPTASPQPLIEEDVVVMLNGWIYDHTEVARRAGSGRTMRSDADAFMEAWRRWGFDLTQHVDGVYTAAIWRRDGEELHLLRGRMGAKPLYWSRSGGRFAFASTLPALLQVPWVSKDIASEQLAEYLSFRVVHAPRTLIRDIHQVEPAHWLRLRKDGLATRRYWRPHYSAPDTRKPRESDVIPALQDAVEHSVKRRLRGGASTGLFLSGGLGSTAIAAAARSLHRELPTFTLSFADDPHPESPFAGRIARLLGLEHHDVVIGTKDIANSFSRGVASMGHPIGHPALFLQLALAQAASDRVDVIFTGDGSDELFGGRMLDSVIGRLNTARRIAKMPPPVRFGLRLAMSRSERGRQMSAPTERYGLELGLGGSNLYSTEERTQLLADPRLVRPTVRYDVLAPFYADLDTDPINQVLHAFMRSWLVEESLARADRVGAAAGLDMRFPLLDREVLTLALALPGSFKVRRRGGSMHTRWPLRAMLHGIVPPPLVNRPKRGLPAPMDHWLENQGRVFLEQQFQRLLDNPHGLWHPDGVKMVRSQLGKPGTQAGTKLWSLFILEEWLSLLD